MQPCMILSIDCCYGIDGLMSSVKPSEASPMEPLGQSYATKSCRLGWIRSVTAAGVSGLVTMLTGSCSKFI